MPKKPKPAAPVSLLEWRELQKFTRKQVLERLARMLPRGVEIITESTLSRMESGHIKRPNPIIVQAIVKLTGGAVSYETLILPPRSAPPRRAKRRAA